MKLFKRSNGYWYVDFTIDGRRIQRSTKAKLKKEAIRYLDKLKEGKINLTSVSLSKFLIEFEEYSRTNKAPSSTYNDLRALGHFIKFVGDRKLESIKPNEIENFKTTRLKTVSRATVNIDLRACKAAFNVALQWGYIKNNPFRMVKQLREVQQPRKYLRQDEIQKLLECTQQQWFFDVILFALNTGCRRGEIINLQWANVDFLKQQLYIENTSEFTVKGGVGRVMPINENIMAMLRQKTHSSEYVLTNANGQKLHPPYVSRSFKRIAINAGLDPKFHFHHLRHTFATTLIQQGVPIYEVQKLLGHSKVSTTEIYAHMNVDTLRSSVAVLDSIIKLN
jgi:site-specific recombinase XerD